MNVEAAVSVQGLEEGAESINAVVADEKTIEVAPVAIATRWRAIQERDSRTRHEKSCCVCLSCSL